MAERINRGDDEGLYNPRIHSERIRELYRIKIMTGIPMTVLLDTAIREFVSSYVNDADYKKLEEYEAREEAREEAEWRRENEYDEKFDDEPTDKMFPDPYEFEP